MTTDTETTLWCCHIRGPDDVIPAKDHATAVAMAKEINAHSAKIQGHLPENERVLFEAAAAPWPWSAESHAKDLMAQSETPLQAYL